jgi:hypothetical protein
VVYVQGEYKIVNAGYPASDFFKKQRQHDGEKLNDCSGEKENRGDKSYGHGRAIPRSFRAHPVPLAEFRIDLSPFASWLGRRRKTLAARVTVVKRKVDPMRRNCCELCLHLVTARGPKAESRALCFSATSLRKALAYRSSHGHHEFMADKQMVCIRLDCKNLQSRKNGLCDKCREIVIKQFVLGNEKPSELRKKLREELGIPDLDTSRLIDSLAEEMSPTERSEFVIVIAKRGFGIYVKGEDEALRLAERLVR